MSLFLQLHIGFFLWQLLTLNAVLLINFYLGGLLALYEKYFVKRVGFSIVTARICGQVLPSLASISVV